MYGLIVWESYGSMEEDKWVDAVAVIDAVLEAKPTGPMEVPAEIALVITAIRPWSIDRLMVGTVADAPSELEASSP